jgi:hypothetical protein
VTRGRAAAALALVLAGLGGWAAPARAAQPTIVFAHLTGGADVKASPVVVDGDAHMANGGVIVGDVRVEMTSADNRPIPPATLVPAGDRATKVPFNVKADLPYNGRYSVRVTATGRDPVPDLDGDEQVVQSVDFKLDVPPAAPAAVATAPAPDRGVALSWKGNGEPDLVGYRVERAGRSGAWAALSVVTAPRFTDTTARDTGGDFRYRVTAVRRAADPSATLASLPSSEARASVPAPPAATASSAGGSGTASGPRVDISDFAALLDRASSAKPARSEPPDPGFRETLPFTPGAKEDGPADARILGSSASETRGPGDHRPLAFVAGSLLATVLLAHVLWVRNEIKKADELEALAPALLAETWEPRNG